MKLTNMNSFLGANITKLVFKKKTARACCVNQSPSQQLMGNMDSKAKLWCAWWTPLLSLAVPFTLSCRGIVAVGWSRPTQSAEAEARNSHRSHGNFIAHNQRFGGFSTAGKFLGLQLAWMNSQSSLKGVFFSDNVKQQKEQACFMTRRIFRM